MGKGSHTIQGFRQTVLRWYRHGPCFVVSEVSVGTRSTGSVLSLYRILRSRDARLAVLLRAEHAESDHPPP